GKFNVDGEQVSAAVARRQRCTCPIVHDSNFVSLIFQRPRQMSRQFDFVLDYENSHEFEFTIASDEARGHTRTTPQYESRSTEECIRFLFRSDLCRRPVTGKHSHIVAEWK